MANNMHLVNCAFDQGAGPQVVREDFLNAESPKAIQANNRPALRNAIKQKTSVVGTITLHIRMEEIRVRVVVGDVRNLAVPTLSEFSCIDRFVNSIFPSERTIFSYNSRAVPILELEDMPEVYRDKSEDVTFIKEDSPLQVRLSKQSEISPR